MPITAHATYNECIRRVAELGIDVVEHGGSMDDETIAILLEKHIPIVTTFAPIVMQAERGHEFGIPEWKIEERKKAVADPKRYTGLVNAANAGVTIIFGTDAGSPVVGHDVVAPELKFMVKLGVVRDNYAALHSSTILPARMNKLDKKLGTLEVGKDADLIVIDGNPLDDLDALTHVQMTIIAGKKMIGVGD